MSQNQKNKGVILFDGFCNLCSRSVQFIIKRDKNDYFRFASLQSKTGKQFLINFRISEKFDKSVVLIEGNSVYLKSRAALGIVAKLYGVWPILYGFIIIPKFIRDSVYMFISKKRYKWFGKRDSCFLAESGYDDKFL